MVIDVGQWVPGCLFILSSECLKFHPPQKKNTVALSICSIYFVKCQGSALDLAKANKLISYHLCL